MRLCHEGRIHVMLQRGLAHGALEQEDLIGKLQRIAMIKVDLELRRAAFMAQRIDIEFLRLAEIINVLDDRIEIIGGVDAIGLAAGLLAARAPDGRLKRIIRVDIALDQIEFEFRGDDRPPALLLVEIEHTLENIAWRYVDRIVIEMEGIADDLSRGLRIPGDQPDGIEIRLQIDIDRRVADGRGFPDITAIDGESENLFGDTKAAGLVAL